MTIKDRVVKLAKSRGASMVLAAITASAATFGAMKGTSKNEVSMYDKAANLVGQLENVVINGSEGVLTAQFDENGDVKTGTLERKDGMKADWEVGKNGTLRAKMDDGSGYPLIFEQDKDGNWKEATANGIQHIKRNIGAHIL